MDAPRWQLVQDLFHRCVDLPAAQRREFLAREAGGDAVIMEVESLLRAHDSAGTEIEAAVNAAIQDVGRESEASWQGRRLGAYVVDRVIDRGGMGLVLLAHRADRQFERRVAIKLLGTVATPDVVRRFRAERQILASLDHPCIARLLDGGETEIGVPYLVMEYIEGVPIDRYCADRKLSVRERLELFRAVCDAVQFAHRNLIVHRDIKPGNVLVTPEGAPKLLDFGIAKLLEPDFMPGAAVETRSHIRALTPEYASPEQVRGENVTTASDVYSLGVLLYEMLTGSRPYSLAGARATEIERLVCEEDPERPSSRVGRMARSQPAGAGQARRLQREFSGDIDTIVQMAMRKEPARRYGSAEQFSEDIRRHLAGLPVAARPDTTRYRVAKFVGRNRGLVASAAGLFLALVTGLAVSMWQHGQAIDAREAERAQREIAEEQTKEARWQAYVSGISAGESSIRLNQIVDARRQLDDAPADLRGWEWHHLRRRLDRSLFALSAHRDIITAICFSADGRQLLCASQDSTISWWNADTGGAVTRWQALPSGIESAEISPDGKLVAAGCSDGTVVVLRAGTGEEVARMQHDYWANVAFHPDGTRLLVAFRSGTVSTWRTDNFKAAQTIQTGVGFARALYSPDGKHVLLAGMDGALRLLDPRTLAVRRTLTGHTRRVMTMAVSRDGSRVVTGSMDRSARVWNLASGDAPVVFRAHAATVVGVAFDAGAAHVVSVAGDRQTLRWDATTASIVAEYRGGGEDAYTVAFSPDDDRFVTGTWEGRARMWDVHSDDVATFRVPELPHMHALVHDARTSPDGDLLVAASERGHAQLWDVSTGRHIAQLEMPSVLVTTQVVFSPDGRRVYVGGAVGDVGVFDLATRRRADAPAGEKRRVVSLDVSPNGEWLLVAKEDSIVTLLDANSLEAGQSLSGERGAIVRACFTPDGRGVIAGDTEGGLTRWEVDTGARRDTWRDVASPVRSFAIDPSGDQVAVLTADDTLRVRDTRTGRVMRRCSMSASRAGAVCFNADATRIATGGADQIIRVLDAASLREVARLHGHVGRILALNFDASRNAFVSASYDGTVRLWDAGSTAVR